MSLDRSVSTDKLNEDLWNAFGKEDTKGMRSLIEHGADPNSYGPTPLKKQSLLHKGAEDGKVEIVKVLLENEADPNMKDLYQRTPLHFAAENGHTDVVRLLLEYKADVSATDMKGVNALILAANVDIVDLLISNGIDIESTDKDGQTALHIAASKGKCDIVKTLLKHGADHSAKDNKGNTPIVYAINNGHNDVVKALIDAGVNVNERVLFFGGDSTLLHHAVETKNVEIVKTLLDHGHPVDAVDGGNWRAFDSACVAGLVDIVEFMLERGASVNFAPNEHMGRVSLHHSIDSKASNPKVVELLLKHKDINVNSQDRDGRTPIYFAANRGNTEVFLLLLKYGAYCGDSSNIIDYDALLKNIPLSKENEELTRQMKITEQNYQKKIDLLAIEHHTTIQKEKAKVEDKEREFRGKELIYIAELDKFKKQDQTALKVKDPRFNAVLMELEKFKEKTKSEIEEKEAEIHKLKNNLENKNKLETEGNIHDKIILLVQCNPVMVETCLKVVEEELQSSIECSRQRLTDAFKIKSKWNYNQNGQDKDSAQPVHFTIDDVAKLHTILQSVEDNWYLLGEQLDIDKSALDDIEQLEDTNAVKMRFLLDRWCAKGGDITNLEKGLEAVNRIDLISGVQEFKPMKNEARNDILSPNTNIYDELLTIGVKQFSFNTGVKNKLDFEEGGLKLIIPPRAVNAKDEFICEVTTQSLWGGEFIFPEGSNLISGICHISFASSSELNKPVTIKLNHCADIVHKSQINCLSFVMTSSDSPPYKFEIVPDGNFNIHEQYGTVLLKKVFLLAIVRRLVDVDDLNYTSDIYPRLYHRGYVYYKNLSSPKRCKMSLVVSQDLAYCSQIVKKQTDKLGFENHSFQFQFADNKNQSLEDKNIVTSENALKLSALPEETKWIDGWNMSTSVKSTIISESDVYTFTQFGSDLPHISLMIQPDPTMSDFKDNFEYDLSIDGINDTKSVVIHKSLNDIMQSDGPPHVQSIPGVQIASRKVFVIKGDELQFHNWEDYGLKISISKGTLPSNETAQISVAATVGGQFIFPENMQLVSAIYAVSESQSFLKPLKFEIQHCVKIVRPSQARFLKFAIAHDNAAPPYKFEIVEGGKFPVNSHYGSIHRTKFCFICQLAKTASSNSSDPNHHECSQTSNKNDTNTLENDEVIQPLQSPQNNDDIEHDGIQISEVVYKGILYDEPKLAIFAAAKNLDALLEYFKNTYSHENSQNINFNIDVKLKCIELEFCKDNQPPGWEIQPLIEPCQLFIRDMNNFGTDGYSLPPKCRIEIHNTNCPDPAQVLRYPIKLKGVIDSPEIIYIIRDLKTSPNSRIEPSRDQQPRDNKQIFRENFGSLSEVMSQSANRYSISSELYSTGLISWECYNEITDSSPKTDQEKATILMKHLKILIDKEPEKLTKLIEALNKCDASKEIADKLSK